MWSIGSEVSSYSHSISVDGGFDDCSFDLGGSREDAEGWLFDAIGAHVVVSNPNLGLVWEGFVNEVSVNLGGLSLTRGPMTDIGNRVATKYQTPSYNFASAGITIGGDQALTSDADDTDSQALYGIRKKVLSGGTASSTEADQLNDTFLSENARPQIKSDVSIGGTGGAVSAKVSCKGYQHLLDYTPDNTAAGFGTMNLSTKLQETLSKDPNTLFSTDYSNVSSNTTQVQKWYDEDRTARDIIKGLVALGDSSFNRYIWGIYGGRALHYEAISTTEHSYTTRMADQGQVFTSKEKTEIAPWDVRPGRYLFVSDFLVGRIIPPTIREDPRMLFIESVNYTAPDNLRLQGGRADTIPQKLARLNLGGL